MHDHLAASGDTFHGRPVTDVELVKRERGVLGEAGHIQALTLRKVVNADDRVPAFEQPLRQIRTDEACDTRDEYFHEQVPESRNEFRTTPRVLLRNP